LNIVEEIHAENAMRFQIAKIFGGVWMHPGHKTWFAKEPEVAEQAFQRIYERERKSSREVLRVLIDVKRQLAA